LSLWKYIRSLFSDKDKDRSRSRNHARRTVSFHRAPASFAVVKQRKDQDNLRVKRKSTFQRTGLTVLTCWLCSRPENRSTPVNHLVPMSSDQFRYG
jgi:hypothetical protein